MTETETVDEFVQRVCAHVRNLTGAKPPELPEGLRHDARQDSYHIGHVATPPVSREFFDGLKDLLEANTQTEIYRGRDIVRVSDYVGQETTPGYHERLLIVHQDALCGPRPAGKTPTLTRTSPLADTTATDALHAPTRISPAQPNTSLVPTPGQTPAKSPTPTRTTPTPPKIVPAPAEPQEHTAYQPGLERLVGHDGFTLFQRQDKPGPLVWAIHIPYERMYRPSELKEESTEEQPAGCRSVLRAVQMLEHGGETQTLGEGKTPSLSITIVLPPRQRAGMFRRDSPPPRCGPLAELYEYFTGNWSWLSDRPPTRKKNRTSAIEVVVADKPPQSAIDKNGIIVWVTTDNPPGAPGTGQWENKGKYSAGLVFEACGVDADAWNGDTEVWRSNATDLDDATASGVLSDEIRVQATGARLQYVLRNGKDSKFRGFWIQWGTDECRFGDPSLLELGVDALFTLAAALGGVDVDDITVIGKENGFPDDGIVFYRAKNDEKPPPAPARAVWSDRFRRTPQAAAETPGVVIDPRGGGKYMVLTGKERNAFAKIAWVTPAETLNISEPVEELPKKLPEELPEPEGPAVAEAEGPADEPAQERKKAGGWWASKADASRNDWHALTEPKNAYTPGLESLVGHDGFTLFKPKQGENAGPLIWAIRIPYDREYNSDKELVGSTAEQPVGHRSVLRAVQMLEHGGKKKPVAVVLPVKPATDAVPHCGPLAELYEYFTDPWSWLAPSPAPSPSVTRSKASAVATFGDDPTKATTNPNGVIVWVTTLELQDALAKIGDGWTDAGPESVGSVLYACGVSPVEWNGDTEEWRATSYDDKLTIVGQPNDDITVKAIGFDQQYILRTREGEFHGFWLQGTGKLKCRFSDPGLLELSYDAVKALAAALGGVPISDVGKDVTEDPAPVVHWAKEGEALPPVLSGAPKQASWWRYSELTKSLPDVFIDGNADGTVMVLTGDDREAFAKLAWVTSPDTEEKAGMWRSLTNALQTAVPTSRRFKTALALATVLLGGGAAYMAWKHAGTGAQSAASTAVTGVLQGEVGGTTNATGAAPIDAEVVRQLAEDLARQTAAEAQKHAEAQKQADAKQAREREEAQKQAEEARRQRIVELTDAAIAADNKLYAAVAKARDAKALAEDAAQKSAHYPLDQKLDHDAQWLAQNAESAEKAAQEALRARQQAYDERHNAVFGL